MSRFVGVAPKLVDLRTQVCDGALDGRSFAVARSRELQLSTPSGGSLLVCGARERVHVGGCVRVHVRASFFFIYCGDWKKCGRFENGRTFALCSPCQLRLSIPSGRSFLECVTRERVHVRVCAHVSIRASKCFFYCGDWKKCGHGRTFATLLALSAATTHSQRRKFAGVCCARACACTCVCSCAYTRIEMLCLLR